MSAEENKAIVRRLIEALDTDNLAALDTLLSPELVHQWHAGINSGPFSEHHATITDMVAEGDKVVARLATQGIHSGEWEGIPATGKRWTNTGAAFCRVEHGKIVELDFMFDELGHVKQLGATLTPPVERTA
jgi:hypothetical protein